MVPSSAHGVMVEYDYPSSNSGRFKRDFARITQIDAPPTLKVAQFFKEVQ